MKRAYYGILRHTCPALALVCLLWSAGCGGGGGTPPTRTVLPATQLMQLTLGDAPLDSVAAFAIPVNSVSLTSTAGTQVSLLSSPVTVEMTHLLGTAMPLVTSSIATGTYTQAVISLGTAQITYLAPFTGQLVQTTLAAPANITVTLTPQFQLTTAPLVLNLELSLAKSISIDTAGNVTFTPTFSTTQTSMASGTTPATPFNGGIDLTIGKVTSVSASSFIIQPAVIAPPMTFTINSTTQFANVGSFSQVLAGMIVSVAGQTQTDGTLLATHVTVMNAFSTSAAVVGQTMTVSGSPATQLQMAELGTGDVILATPPLVGTGVTADLITSTPAFGFDGNGFDFTGLGFTPSFHTAADVRPVQMVETDTTLPVQGLGGTMLGLPVVFTIAPSQVQLQPQGLVGTVSAFTGTATAGTFTLTVPSDSVFAILARTTTLTIHTQSKTVLTNMTGITNGSTVVARGLLFFDVPSNSYRLVASRIMPTP